MLKTWTVNILLSKFRYIMCVLKKDTNQKSKSKKLSNCCILYFLSDLKDYCISISSLWVCSKTHFISGARPFCMQSHSTNSNFAHLTWKFAQRDEHVSIKLRLYKFQLTFHVYKFQRFSFIFSQKADLPSVKTLLSYSCPT